MSIGRAAIAGVALIGLAMGLAAQERVEIRSTADGSMQPALVAFPDGASVAMPLLV